MTKDLITIFICTYNEELLLPHTIRFYRTRFPGCPITIIDNFSMDSTVRIAESAGCNVLHSHTHGKMRDEALKNIKNEVWKTANTPWVIVGDTDMWLDINRDQLLTEDSRGVTLIRMTWYEMVGSRKETQIPLTKGMYYYSDQIMCFNKEKILSMNYDYGAHEALPIGILNFSDRRYPMYHHKWLSLEYVVARYARLRKRYTPRERRMGLSVHYFYGWFKLRRIWKKLNRNAVPLNY